MIYAIVTVLVLIADQAVKFWTTKNILLGAIGDECAKLIPGFVHMTNVHNYGAAFGILQDARWPLAAVSALFVLVIIILINKEVIHTRFGRWTAVLIMAGAIGNCIDRVLYGYVVDMFEFEFALFGKPFSFPVFNVADIFITVCGILFCIHVLFHNEPEAVKEANAPEFIRKRRVARREQEEREAAAARQREERPARKKPAPAAAEEPLDSWGFGDVVEEPVRKPAKKKAAPAEEAAVPAEPAPRKSRRKAEAEPKAERPARARAAKPAPEPKAVRPAPAPEPAEPETFPDPVFDDGEEKTEFTLEDILAEFGDY